MKIICRCCGDIIEEVDEDYELSMFQHYAFDKDFNEVVIMETGLRCCGAGDW